MATNKHAIIRYQTLDKCFRNPGRRYYIDDLVEACNQAIYEFAGIEDGIKKRQIFEDIKFMESEQGWNVHLEHSREKHKVFYHYADRSFSINKQPLNETEENQLKEALLTLSRFKGMPQFEWVDEITARLDSGLGLSGHREKIIEFEQNYFLTGLEFITPLYNAILYKKSLDILYKSFKKEEVQTLLFHPYYLKQYNNRWYLFGKNDESGFIMNLALDRIVEIIEAHRIFKPNSEVDFNEYFEDVVGVTVDLNAQIENVVLKVSNMLFPYIYTKPIHGSQKVKQKEEMHTLISLELIPNFELESILLSHGEGIEVLEPESLRERILKRLDLNKNNYQNKNADVVH